MKANMAPGGQTTINLKKGEGYMKFKSVEKALMVTALILMVGTPLAFAHGGWDGYDGNRGPRMGYQGGPMMGPGGGFGQRMGGYGRANALTEEEAAKLEPIREKFLKDTEPLRLQLNEKRFLLQQELSKQNPDAEKAAQLQTELSTLRGEFAQKALAHRLEVRSLFPEKSFGPGIGRGFGRGAGRGCW
jgi:hypothetical protein